MLAGSFPHQATYWSPGAPDGFGGRVMGEPQLIDVRWQEDAVMFRDQQGRDVPSDALVYTTTPIEVRGYLALGDKTGEDPKTAGTEIRRVGTSPSLRGDEQLYKAYL